MTTESAALPADIDLGANATTIAPRDVSIATVVRYLFGSRQAILSISASPQALWLGLMFVISAGFAREYDGEYLLREPWHLLIPLVASLGTSFVLYLFVSVAASARKAGPFPFWGTYRRFLTLYWMTAPLAWLYAIPVERFLDAGDSTLANLGLLALVSAWRVLLITRVISVLFNSGKAATFCIVMLFSCIVAISALFVIEVPIIDVMGGIRHTESEQHIEGAVFLVGAFVLNTFLVWLIGTLVVLARRVNPWRLETVSDAGHVTRGAWSVAAVAIVGWTIVLPFAQQEQALRWHAETLLKTGRIEGALQLMARYEQGDFPPHWDPPPRPGYGITKPSVVDVLEAAEMLESPDWIPELFRAKLGVALGDWQYWDEFDERDFERLVTRLEKIPNGKQIARENEEALKERLLENSKLPAGLHDRVNALLAPFAKMPPAKAD